MYQLLKLVGNDIHAEEETKLQLVERRLKGEKRSLGQIKERGE